MDKESLRASKSCEEGTLEVWTGRGKKALPVAILKMVEGKLVVWTHSPLQEVKDGAEWDSWFTEVSRTKHVLD
jgi:hypothetical protein